MQLMGSAFNEATWWFANLRGMPFAGGWLGGHGVGFLSVGYNCLKRNK